MVRLGPPQQLFYMLRKKIPSKSRWEKKTAYGHGLSTALATLQHAAESAWLEELALICTNEFTFGKTLLDSKRLLKF